jgi:uncharacterized protein (TIGR03437 family)
MKQLVICVLVSYLGLCAQARGQNIINTVAGGNWVFPAGVTVALNAPLGGVSSVAVDSQGNVYVADLGNSRIFRVSPSGGIQIVAGNGTVGYSSDGGPAIAASLNLGASGGVAVDASGNLFIADQTNSRIRKVSPSGIITTVAGSASFGFSGDGGPATSAELSLPASVAVDASGNLFIADLFNNRIRKVSAASGIITTVAGNGDFSFSGDGGPATSAALAQPTGVAVDASGNLFIVDFENNRIRKVSANGIISTVAGNGTQGFSGDGGPATSAELNYSSTVAVDASGNLFIADTYNNRIRKVSASGIISTVAGDGTPSYVFSGDGGPAIAAALNRPAGVAVDVSGNLFIADTGYDRVRKVSASGIINTVAGNGGFLFSGDGGPAVSASLNSPQNVVVDASANLFIAVNGSYRIRKVSAGGIITTVAGNGAEGFSGDGGPATAASFGEPTGVAVDAGGNLFIADAYNNRIRKVSAGGIITTAAGNGTAGFSGDGGPATSAALQLGFSGGVAVDSSGNLLIADTGNNRIRKVSAAGVITTVAGNGTQGFSGDGGLATAAELYKPVGIAVDASGNLFFADLDNYRIRKVSASGIITTVAGNGTAAFSGDGGPATSASLGGPYGVAVDAGGELFIADTYNNLIRKVSASGIITTVAGGGSPLTPALGDGGPATSAWFDSPEGVAVDVFGNLFIADTFNNRIREVVAQAGNLYVAPVSLTFQIQQGAPAQAQTLEIGGTAGTTWHATVTTSTGGAWLSVSPTAGQIQGSLSALVSSGSLTPGTYQGSITIQAGTSSNTVGVALTVTAAPPGQLTVTPASLKVQAQSGGVNVAAQTLTIGNSGGGTLNWTATVSTANGGNWLSLGPSSGSAILAFSSAVQVSFSVQGLPPGVYNGTISINAGAITVPVSLLISSPAPVMVVGQSGLLLTGVAGGSPPSQTATVANTEPGTMNWTAALVAGNVFSLPVSSGVSTSGPGTPPTFTVQGNTANLAAGVYYGLIQVSAPGAVNSPQSVSVVLNVLPSSSAPPLQVFPQGLIAVAPAGGSSAPQTVSLATASAAAVTGAVSVATQSGGNWLSASPGSLSLSPRGSLTINASTASLSAGVYSGIVTVIPSDGSPTQQVSAYLVVTPGSNMEASSLKTPAATTACSPAKLVMAMQQLGNNFASPVGWPVSLEAEVVDDCGNPAPAATVVASFSNGDPPLALVGLGNGIYSATWKPANRNVTVVTVQAAQSLLAPVTITLSGNVGVNSAPPPSVGSGGVVNGASFAAGAALAPGTIVSVFGTNLGTSNGNLAGFPLPTTLANIKLTIGGIDAPLFYAGTGQVNAQIPYQLTAGSQSQVVARALPASGGELDAVPEPITIGATGPGIFIASGTQGAILNVQNQVVNSANPATAGDVIVIFCTGLGALNPAAQTGQPASSGVAVVQPVVTVGGVTAGLQYAGVAPGFVGLYQVNVAVPSGVTPGFSVPVIITQNGVASNAATIAVH